MTSISRWLWVAAWSGLALGLTATSVRGDDAFETQIRPLFVERCQSCHGPEKQKGNLRVDSREALVEGGDNGPAVVPGDPADSLLIAAVRRSGDLKMPPDDKQALAPEAVAALERWIVAGAPWPKSSATPATTRKDVWARHWAFQPVADPTPPSPADASRVRTPVDAFILSQLDAAGLSPAPEADRRTLIRRVAYDLTGLPPTAVEVAAFVADPDPDAYEKLVDRLLASPRYGQQWGRLWLDVARYSDTKGYVYAREERFLVPAPSYRDWVVKAFNDDMPYDRFLVAQIAADQAEPSAAAAMGFLTVGRRFLGVSHDVIDDRIDVVCRGTMALTVGCARCHDHKYDPIPTADYYSLYGVFMNATERLVRVGDGSLQGKPSEAFEAELRKRLEAMRKGMIGAREEAAKRARTKVADYLLAQLDLASVPQEGFDIIVGKNDVVPAVVRRWAAYLDRQAKADDPIFRPWRQVIGKVSDSGETPLNPRVASAFATPAASPREAAERYAKLFAEVDEEWRTALKADVGTSKEPSDVFPPRGGRQTPRASDEGDDRHRTRNPATTGNAEPVPPHPAAARPPSPARGEGRDGPDSHLTAAGLPDPAAEALRRVLYADDSPCLVPDAPIVSTEGYFDTGTIDAMWKLQGQVDRWLIQPQAPPFAVEVVDRTDMREARIFRRGSAANQGDTVPRRFLQVVAGPDAKPFEHGAGRLDLARAIVDPTNPLTARVWVNRIWARHFGAGLVRTPSDFGVRAEPPSHPELLDWLATRLVQSGWSTKTIHRLIVLSSAYRQRSDAPTSAKAEEVDPENRLLWRMNAHRLTFEELRDSLLTVAGELDDRMGGRASPLFDGSSNRRRTLYGLVDRQFLPGVFRTFDFANPDLHTPARGETTVPQQALFALNNPFVADRARTLAAMAPTDDPEAGVSRLYEAIHQRPPTPSQTAAAVAFLQASADDPEPSTSPESLAWSYGYGLVDAKAGPSTTSFTPLPHFDGQGWGGGAKWPDRKLGWARITAEGGHPGDDLRRSIYRRWTSPVRGEVAVASTLIHEQAAGDGVRGWLVHGRRGVLKSAAVHNGREDFSVGSIAVEPGDTLDFVVDVRDGLNSDQHLWAPTVRVVKAEPTSPALWDAHRDFGGAPPRRLSPLEQLAQVLLMSNEFIFVD